jgi:hypothetical protein
MTMANSPQASMTIIAIAVPLLTAKRNLEIPIFQVDKNRSPKAKMPKRQKINAMGMVYLMPRRK